MVHLYTLNFPKQTFGPVFFKAPEKKKTWLSDRGYGSPLLVA